MPKSQITKNQHYVPRFYLKSFSVVKNVGSNKEKSLISFYQYKNQLSKDMIPTDSVCSSDYFYDNDGNVENMLAEKEKMWANTIHKANNNTSLDECDINNLKEFVIYQIVRTKAELEHSREVYMAMIEEGVSRKNVEINLILKSAIEKNVKENITSEYEVNKAEEFLPYINDLKLIVLDNKTAVDFFTSDAPVIITNPLSTHDAGLACIGTTIFLPISPKKIVMLYDAKLFESISTELTDDKTVVVFNKYQCICAHERVLGNKANLFSDYVNDQDVNKYREDFCKLTKPQKSTCDYCTFMSIKPRVAKYYIDIPMFQLPKKLRKIPRDFRETFPRAYSVKYRDDIILKIYCQIPENESSLVKENLKKRKEYAKVLLDYFDYYWNTPSEDRTTSSEKIQRIKNAKGTFYKLQ